MTSIEFFVLLISLFSYPFVSQRLRSALHFVFSDNFLLDAAPSRPPTGGLSPMCQFLEQTSSGRGSFSLREFYPLGPTFFSFKVTCEDMVPSLAPLTFFFSPVPYNSENSHPQGDRAPLLKERRSGSFFFFLFNRVLRCSAALVTHVFFF